MFFLQIVKADYYIQKAKSQHELTVKVEPHRGRILDNKGRILAVSVKLKSLFAKPNQLESPSEYEKGRLSLILKVPYHKLFNDLKSRQQFIWIKRRLHPQQTRLVQKLGLKGIGFIEEYRRFYPNGNFAGQLWGIPE